MGPDNAPKPPPATNEEAPSANETHEVARMATTNETVPSLAPATNQGQFKGSKLKGSENYSIWSFQMTAYLKGRQLWNAATEAKPSKDDPAQQLAFAILVANLTDDMVFTIIDKETAKEVWNSLKSTCRAAASTNKHFLAKEFRSKEYRPRQHQTTPKRDEGPENTTLQRRTNSHGRRPGNNNPGQHPRTRVRAGDQRTDDRTQRRPHFRHHSSRTHPARNENGDESPKNPKTRRRSSLPSERN